MEISLLLFADNTVLLCRATSEILRAIRCVLLCYEAVFRMKVNLGKNRISGPVGEVGGVSVAGSLGCKLGWLLTNDLSRFAIGSSFKARMILEF